jgi:histidinol dehydrogenase
MDPSLTDLETTVNGILKQVQSRGDDAIIKLTQEYDGIPLTKQSMPVSKDEIESAFDKVDNDFISSLKSAIENITYFHEKQKRTSWFTTEKDGVMLGQRIVPIEKVGVYIPGGLESSPSSVLMNVIPAKVAGVERIIMVTPPTRLEGLNPYLLVAMKEVGVSEIFKVGGAQAIGALAFGTETIPKVDKVVGSGGAYITVAKRLVSQLVDIDMFTGPAELIILADESANPVYIAIDMISQAEHEEMASSILITTSQMLGEEVKIEIERQINKTPRKRIVEKSLTDYGAIVISQNLDDGIRIINDMSPENLQIMTNDSWGLLDQIKNAGAILIGNHSPQTVSDYFAGINRVMPTGGTAKFHSPLSVDDFVKRINVAFYTRERLIKDHKKIIELFNIEGLDGHNYAIEERL